jgi:hypothetical protein
MKIKKNSKLNEGRLNMEQKQKKSIYPFFDPRNFGFENVIDMFEGHHIGVASIKKGAIGKAEIRKVTISNGG